MTNRDLLILGIAAVFAVFLGAIFKMDLWVMCWSGFALGWFMAKSDCTHKTGPPPEG